MRIRWRLSAVDDLTAIRDYIAARNPVASRTVIERILRSVKRLERYPESGRPGRVEGTREVVVPGLPYIVVYSRDTDNDVAILAVFHAARTPPEFP